MSWEVSFGLAGQWRHEFNRDAIIEALKEFAALGYVPEFVELVGESLYRITYNHGVVNVEMVSEKVDEEFKRIWKQGEDMVNHDLKDLYFGDGKLFLPGTSIGSEYIGYDTGLFNFVAEVEGMNGIKEDLEERIKETQEGENEPEYTTDDVLQYLRIFDIAIENKFIWDSLYC